MTAREIIDIYISFFEKREHKRIPNSPLIPDNDPTTLFTSSGMQPLVPYLLGQAHPQGTRLVNVQNCFRAVDIDEVGDNRHTTFFRMLGNWSLGDYFKKEEIPWLWELLTKELKLPKEKLYITVFKGNDNIPFDSTAEELWKEIFEKEGIQPKIFHDPTNWWSRSGMPDKMPAGEPGGPDTEVYYRFDDVEHNSDCKGDDPTLCECGKFLEIANSVFMQYLKQDDGSFNELPKLNVDFGGGLERLIAATEDKSDIFKTSLFMPVIKSLEENILTKFKYGNEIRVDKSFRIIANHLVSAVFLINSGILPGNKERESVTRRLIRKAVAQKFLWGDKEKSFSPVIDIILETYRETDPELKDLVKKVIEDEEIKANRATTEGFKAWSKWVETEYISNPQMPGDFMPGEGGKLPPLSAEKMFDLYQSYGLSPDVMEDVTQGNIDKEGFNKLLEKHHDISRAGATKKFAGGLADHSEQTVRGHTATHLMHQAIRDMLGTNVHQSGSNITSERVRFDFNFDRNLTEEEIKELEETVNEKIKAKMPVYFEFMPLTTAKEIGAIGLFDEKYSDKVKIYLIGDKNPEKAYSKEFCGGPHVNFTDEVKSFKIIKQENIGNGLRRLYVTVG